MGLHEDVQSHSRAGRWERESLAEPPLEVGLVLVNLFINDPEAGEGGNGRLIKTHR